jgi:hypothetical protein
MAMELRSSVAVNVIADAVQPQQKQPVTSAKSMTFQRGLRAKDRAKLKVIGKPQFRPLF